jgi:hypothetical protein
MVLVYLEVQAVDLVREDMLVDTLHLKAHKEVNHLVH